MLQKPSRHDGLSNNQAARDLQRERQRQERAQMLASDDAGLSPNIQDLFNAPVKVKPSVEDPTSIEIRKTFGSYDSARPFLTDSNGLLQRRLIGVDQTVNAISGGASTSLNPSGDHRPPVSSGSGLNSSALPPQKPVPVVTTAQHRSFSGTTSTNTSTTVKPEYQNLFKNIPPSIGHSSSQKGSLINPPSSISSQPFSTSMTYVPTAQGSTSLVSSLNHIQNISRDWNIPTPISPFPVRRNNKLSTTTLPITFVTTSSLNSTTTATSDIGSSDVFKLPVKPNQIHLSTAATTSTTVQPTTTTTHTPNLSVVKSEVKSVGNLGSSLGAPSTAPVCLLDKEKSNQQHTFKKPLERNDSRTELENMIREMMDVKSPLAAILPKETSPKKAVTGRSSNSDERAIEALEGINDLKTKVAPLSPTGMNSSSSSSGSDSSDSDSDSDSSTSTSEQTTPSTTPVKNAPGTTRSPTERENWGLSSFVGGIRKENALIEAASTSLEPSKKLENSSYSIPEVLNKHPPPPPPPPQGKPESVTSFTSGSTKVGSNTNSSMIQQSKALTSKSTGFPKPTVSQSKTTNKEAAYSKGTNPGSKGMVLSKSITTTLPPTVKINPAILAAHKDPTLSGSSSEDEAPPPPPPPPPVVNHVNKEKEAEKPKSRVPTKRPSTTNIESIPPPPIKKSRRSSSQTAAAVTLPPPPSPPPPPPPVVSEKLLPKLDEKEKQGKSKTLDRVKKDMLGKLFRKKEKAEEGSKEKDVPSVSPRDRENKTGNNKLRRKSSPITNRVSAKDSAGRKQSISPGHGTISMARTNGEIRSILDKVEKQINLGEAIRSSGGSKSRRSSSPTKGLLVKSNSSGSTNMAAAIDKSDKMKHSSSKLKKIEKTESTNKRKLSSTTEHHQHPPPLPPPPPHPPHPKVKPGTAMSPPKGKSSSDLKQTKQKLSSQSPKHKSKIDQVKTSTSSSTTKPSKTSSSSSSTNSLKSTSSRGGGKTDPKSIMPPPPPPPSHHSPVPHHPSHTKENRGNKKDSIPKLPVPLPSLMVEIPLKLLRKVPKVPKKAELPGGNHGKSSSEVKGSREDKKVETKPPKSHVGHPSLVGSSVEDLTDTHIVPSKVQRTSGGSDQLKSSTKDHSSSNSSSKSHKRAKNRSSHDSSKKSRLKSETEVEIIKEIKAPPEKKNTSSCEPSAITAYSGGTTAVKTPPEPPDSSLNPTHSASPTLAPPQPQYLSYFEKANHDQEEFFAFDQSYYLSEAKRLKHRADKEDNGLPQILTYMDSALYFILTGILMERLASVQEAQEIYEQTLNLIRHIAVRPRSGMLGDDLQEIKLLILTFRVQSLLSLQLYKAKSREISDSSVSLMEHFHPKNAPPPPSEVGMIPVTRSPRTTVALNTPSPRSPALSPAGSGPASVGSGTTSIHSPHHSSQQTVKIPKNLYQKFSKFVRSTNTLITAHDLWTEADNYVERFRVQDFFIPIDRIYGPLTMHSSLIDLVRYVRCGLKNLNPNLLESS